MSYQNPLQRNSKKIKKNSNVLNLQTSFQIGNLNSSKTPTSVPHKNQVVKRKSSHQNPDSHTNIIQYYPEPLQKMIKLKQNLSLLDIAYISKCVEFPTSDEFEQSLQQMNKVATFQENTVKNMIKLADDTLQTKLTTADSDDDNNTHSFDSEQENKRSYNEVYKDNLTNQNKSKLTRSNINKLVQFNNQYMKNIAEHQDFSIKQFIMQGKIQNNIGYHRLASQERKEDNIGSEQNLHQINEKSHENILEDQKSLPYTLFNQEHFNINSILESQQLVSQQQSKKNDQFEKLLNLN